ncbi:hypothetical protein CYY_006466 [Polysphondylium violaceum]|uniref:Actin binding protein E n=1 Tax=Polysphondylium violaceum TaxID=133409 RepID=A0A8J4PZU9_9MYCE|nr:hypothetical protein CYY_006466 [Polysphondylium violaceum]
MASLDLNDAEIAKNIKLVQDGSEQHRWVAFGYVPKTNNKLKLYDHGPGDLKELREELGDATIRFAYIRYTINNMTKFVYIAWCGDGVNGPIKGSFSGHAIEFAKHLKPIHHQLNARNEDDIDEKAIVAALNKATGASYDSGAKVQGNTKAFVPTSVAQGRELSAKSNAEVKQVINKQDYNKIAESADYWKQNQAAAKDPQAKPARPEYNITTEREQYWKNQQEKPVSAPAPAASKAAPTRSGLANKFEQQHAAPVAAPVPAARPTPTRSGLASKFEQQHAAPAAAPPPPRSTKPAVSAFKPQAAPVYSEPEPVYEEQQHYEEQQYQEEPQQHYEEQQYQQEEQQYEEQYQQEEPQQHYEEQQYQEEPQQYEEQYQEQQYQEEPQQHYEEQQQYEEQQYQEEPQQHYEEQQQYEEPEQHYEEQASAGGYQVKALYDYPGENEGDLAFNAGDIITVLDQSDPNGWWQGELNGVTGFFPCNFIENL